MNLPSCSIDRTTAVDPKKFTAPSIKSLSSGNNLFTCLHEQIVSTSPCCSISGIQHKASVCQDQTPRPLLLLPSGHHTIETYRLHQLEDLKGYGMSRGFSRIRSLTTLALELVGIRPTTDLGHAKPLKSDIQQKVSSKCKSPSMRTLH